MVNFIVESHGTIKNKFRLSANAAGIPSMVSHEYIVTSKVSRMNHSFNYKEPFFLNYSTYIVFISGIVESNDDSIEVPFAP